MLKTNLIVRLFFLLVLSSLQPARAAVVTSGLSALPGQPVQDLILSPGTPFNPGQTEVRLADVTATGVTLFERATQVGNRIDMSNGRFTGTGTYQGLGNFTLKTGQPNGFTPMTAVLENVVQDANHPGFATGDPASIISANITYTVPNWGVRLDDLGIELEVRSPFSFTGTLNGLPPTVATTIADPQIGSGQDRQAVFLAGTNTVIGFSTNRRYIFAAVPEPSAAMFGFMLSGLLVFRRPRSARGQRVK